MKKINNHKTHKNLYVSILLLFIVGAVFYFLEITHKINIFGHKTQTTTIAAPITQLPPKPVANNGIKNPAVTTGGNKQTSTDQNGSSPTTTSSNSNNWLVSQSGLITVKLPTSNSNFNNGDSLYGSASSSLSSIQYTLIDNQVGVISQGTLKSVNGSFSGIIHFSKSGTTGRLDVYSTDNSGKEFNLVEVPIKL